MQTILAMDRSVCSVLIMTQVLEIWRDNLTTIQMTANPVLHVRTKHVKLDLYFVRDIVVQKQIL